jgi:hypothetical protein
MKGMLSVVALALGTVMPLVAQASDLKPLEAGTFLLGTHTASIYYTASGDMYEVVTTIAPAPDTAGAPIRFVGFLQPGQKTLVSVGGFGTARASETLELVHQGHSLSATRVLNKAVAG